MDRAWEDTGDFILTQRFILLVQPNFGPSLSPPPNARIYGSAFAGLAFARSSEEAFDQKAFAIEDRAIPAQRDDSSSGATLSPIEMRPRSMLTVYLERAAAYGLLGALLGLAYPRRLPLIALGLIGLVVGLEAAEPIARPTPPGGRCRRKDPWRPRRIVCGYAGSEGCREMRQGREIALARAPLAAALTAGEHDASTLDVGQGA